MPGPLHRVAGPARFHRRFAMPQVPLSQAKLSRDELLRHRLKKLDESETVDVTQWEADFIESVVYRYDGPMSQRQQESALRIVEKYGF
jgi:hypothetical protein